MSSKVEIANRAATKLGADRILALTDENKVARTLNSLFESVKESELREHNWNFATKRASLAASTTAPVWGFAYAYPLPAKFLKLLDIDGVWTANSQSSYVSRDQSMFRIETVLIGGYNTKCIVTDMAAPLLIKYTESIEDPTLFDSCFVEAFASKLAMESCEAITGSSAKYQQMVGQYLMAINAAIGANAVENPPALMADTSWLQSRL